jgi:TPR repeat protein
VSTKPGAGHTASFKIKKAGYMAGEPADRVGALTLEALSRYDKNREASLEFFATHERDFQSAKQTPSQIPLSKGEASQDKAEVANLHRHADQGNADAQFFLGLIYETGDGAPLDYGKAAKWYCLAADQGHAHAQSSLGSMYLHGRGMRQDHGEAAKWYRLAAEQGNAVAQFNLGAMNHKGRGMPQHYAEAMRWYRLAAHQGNALAQLAFGLMYANGRGVPQDYIEACKWFNLSAAQGNQDAVKSLAISTNRMTSAQIAEAQKLAREWKPTKQPPSR